MVIFILVTDIDVGRRAMQPIAAHFMNTFKEMFLMTKRKPTKAELEYGIGVDEIDEDGIEPEVEDDEEIAGLAADEENDQDDDELIEAFHKDSVEGNDVWRDA